MRKREDSLVYGRVRGQSRGLVTGLKFWGVYLVLNNVRLQIKDVVIKVAEKFYRKLYSSNDNEQAGFRSGYLTIDHMHAIN